MKRGNYKGTLASKKAKHVPPSQKKRTRIPVQVSIGRQAFPRQLFSTLKYVEMVTLTLNSLGLQQHLFSCNGMFDPNITGIGHQPLYFDQTMAIYNHYTVLRSRIKVTPSTFSNAIGQPDIMCALYIDDDTVTGFGAAGSMATVMERPLSRSFNYNPELGNNDRSLWHSWDGVKIFGGNLQSNDQLQGTAAANPVEQSYYAICVDATILGASQTLDVWVQVEYECVFDEYKSMGTS